MGLSLYSFLSICFNGTVV